MKGDKGSGLGFICLMLVLFDTAPGRLHRSLLALQLDNNGRAECGLSLKTVSLNGKFPAFFLFLPFSHFPNRDGGVLPSSGVTTKQPAWRELYHRVGKAGQSGSSALLFNPVSLKVDRSEACCALRFVERSKESGCRGTYRMGRRNGHSLELTR